MKKDEIKEFLDSMSNSIGRDQIELYKKLINEKCFDELIGYEEFRFGLIYAFEQFISGLIKSKISSNRDVEFIFKKSREIERHFRYWIEKTEGMFCCADKSRTIILRLIDFYKEGKRIEFDYAQEYTFHFPKVIFKTHEEIIEFYEGVKNLNYGNPTKYLLALKKITELQRTA